jgi:hypothetical protein
MRSANTMFLLACVSQAHAQSRPMNNMHAGPTAGRSAQSMPGANTPGKVTPPTMAANAAVSAAVAASAVQAAPPVQTQQQAFDVAVPQSVPLERKIEFPSPGFDSEKSFDLVSFRGEETRSLFQKVVSYFDCPTGMGGGPTWSPTWFQYQNEMETKVVRDRKEVPVVAMKGGIPCAAAAYSDAQGNDQNTFVLSMLIRNAKDKKQCAGGGAAIMCHLIRNSKSAEGSFSPLKLSTNRYEQGLTRWVEAFGCTTTESSGKTLHWDCQDPSPQKCEEVVDPEVLDAASLYVNFDGSEPSRLLQTSQDVSSSSAAMLIGFFAISGIIFAMRRFRRNTLAMCEEPLLVA